MKGRKNRSVRISRRMAERIPYREAYKKHNVIQGMDGRYTRMYRVGDMAPELVTDYDPTAAVQAMEQLIDAMPEDVSFQFVVHNRLITGDGADRRFMVDLDDKEAELLPHIRSYNRTVRENMEIGHNNSHKDIYYVLSVKAENAGDAARRLEKLEEVIRERFSDYNNLELETISFPERLKIIYSMYHPMEDSFGEKIDLKGTGEIDLKNLKYMRMDTKDLVAPESFQVSKKWIDYGILNEGRPQQTYVRSFFVHSIPREVSLSFISDLTGISSQMLFSIIYEPMDTELGFAESSERVAENTVVIKKSLRGTLKERKNRAKTRIEEEKELNEETYFNSAALNFFKRAKAGNNKAFACTITIVLYASDIEALDKDTQLLYLSAAKFSGNVQTLDLKQEQGFQTCLPLCQSRVDCLRMIDIRRLAVMSPVGIQDALGEGGMFLGINSINDRLVMLNRRNNPDLTGMIAGSDHPGKSYQLKREIFNALIGSRDRIHIITADRSYDAFVKMLGGMAVNFQVPDVHDMERGYGLLSNDEKFKDLFYEALGEAGADATAVSDTGERQTPADRRLTLHKAQGAGEMLMVLDALWNRTLRDKHKGIDDQIFIDAADPLIALPVASEYFESLIVKCAQFQTIVTFVVDNSVKLFQHPVQTIALERITRSCGYVKLLNSGPIERGRFAEILSLPDALLPYISNVEPGKGIIVTPASNIAFNDNFTELYPDGAFKDLFAREVKQIGL